MAVPGGDKEAMRFMKHLGHREGDKKYRGIGLFQCPYCLKETIITIDNGKRQKSCGCMAKKLIAEAKINHGDSRRSGRKKLYQIWQSMKHRCRPISSHPMHKYYGGKGVRVCLEWQTYIGFRTWALINGYKEGLSLDRINTNRNYCPTNCQWITKAENFRKDNYKKKLTWRLVKLIRTEAKPKNLLQQELSQKYGISQASISDILRNRTWKEIAELSS